MDLTGFLSNLVVQANSISRGRIGLATDGAEHNGRINYEKGIAGSKRAFEETEVSGDPQLILLAELVFLQQELQFCNEDDTDAHSSLTQAIQSFEDALRCLKTVEDAVGYCFAETTHPTTPKYRVQSFPKDAFHLACIAHRTRLRNALRATGTNMIEKVVLKQRIATLSAAQGSYVEKQKKALLGPKRKKLL
jgi:hypothetical protein